MKLSQKWIDYLVGLPETGMGYQNVTVHLKNGEKREGTIVIGCQDIDSTWSKEEINFSEDDITDITMS